MNIKLVSPMSRFVAVFLMTQMIVMPIKADWFWHQPAPVVVYHEPAPIVVYHETPPVDAVMLGACALGVGVCAGIATIFGGNSQKKKFREYTEMFKDLGYSRAEAQVYAKLALDNPGGYAAVVENIEREKELKYQRETQQRLMQQQIQGQQRLEQLKHQQKIEQMHHQQQSQYDNYQKIALIMLIVFLSLGTVFLGILLFQRLKRND